MGEQAGPSTGTDIPAKFMRDLLRTDQGNARWLIRMRSGYEYRASIYEQPAGTGIAVLYLGNEYPEYIRLDQIEAVRRVE